MSNVVQQAIEQSILQAAQQVEAQLDQQLHKLENLEEDDLERLRQKRLDELKRMQQKKQEWLQRGHGEYSEIAEPDFFKDMKGEERMVCHFYRDSMPCKVMDKHLAILAVQHVETRFVKINAEKAPFLTEKLRIWMLPTLAIIMKEVAADYVVGFDELGGTEDFSTETLAARLAAVGAIFEDEVPKPRVQPEAQRTMKHGGPPRRTESDEDSDFD